MQVFTKLATAGAIAIAGMGLTTAGASAYSISGGAYTGTATAANTFSIAGAFTFSCPAANTTFAGTATGSATTSFVPSYGPGCTFFGLPMIVTQSGSWELTATSGPVGGVYTHDIHIPAGTSTTIHTPSTGCLVRISGPQTFVNQATATNTASGVSLQANVSGIAYTATSCPYPSGTTGRYQTNGNVDIPGITIS